MVIKLTDSTLVGLFQNLLLISIFVIATWEIIKDIE